MSEIIMNYSHHKISSKKSKSLLDEMDDMERESISMISSFRPKAEKKSKVDELQEANTDGDDWLRNIETFKAEPIKGTLKNSGSIFVYFGEDGKKKKKKKKKDKDEMIDYNKEFEPEMNLLQNLLSEQSRFTSSLQKRYDTLESTKSSARGVGKFTTDLITSINQGRSTSLQIASNIVSLKKTIADLNMKERKERAAAEGGDYENMGDYSANFLKQVLRESRKDIGAYGDDSPIDGDASDIFANVASELADSDRSDEIEKYLQYEKDDVQIYAFVNKETHDYHLEAMTADGRMLDDYPIPQIRSLEINESTEVASDEYHTKYPIIWE